VSLRETIEADLASTLENPDDYGLPVELIAPDGTIQTKSANDATADLSGQILYDTRAEEPETGAEIIIHKPVVTLRRTSLDRIPIPGEDWIVRIPITPSLTATKEDFALERPGEDGGAIGFIRLYLTRVSQS
jgi:hypothetical protein